ncbi:MAG TPA: VWA domain-containing protein [Spirochaetota bacterium]|nr:VWA domain-containing protein [Spirochaetota bacterium]HOM10323.1 VWA domain-containing protein [Spirochaetota bacterium]HPP49994.1 VWA domain-containing protein [Spirochaetota bacterium]
MIYDKAFINEEDKAKGVFFEFAEVLKKAGVNLSIVEVMDMMHALPLISIAEKEIFKQTLATTLIKDYTDIPIFNQCFEEFFQRKKGNDSLLEVYASHTNTDDFIFSQEEKSILESLIDDFLDSHPQSFFKKSNEYLTKIFINEIQSSEAGGAIGLSLFNRRSRFASGGAEDSIQQELSPQVFEAIMGMLRRRMFERNMGSAIKQREDYLLNKYIYQLKPDEIKEMRELIKRFGQKMKNRISLRKKKVKRGTIDIKRTLRRNLQYGGVPFKIFHRDRKVDRPQLVVMCDISSSVNQYSRFMLLLTYTLQSLFAKVRTFAFISNLVEITDLFREMDPERALNSIFNDTNFTYGWGSNYGNSFNQFIQNYSDALTSKTTVLILGDARNNNQDPGLDSFIKIKERSRNIYWLNPDRKHLWDWSDSIASLYIPHCTEMREVKNFLDLSHFIDTLFIQKRNYK